MTKPTNLVGDHSFLNSSKGSYPQKAKGSMSSFGFLLFTFVCISVFYIFNLSPSTLFNTTKFWFLITNTLILIIAADYGASSSKKELGLYDEDNMPSKVKNSTSALVSQHPEVVYQETTPKRSEVVVWHEKKIITQVSNSFSESCNPHVVMTNTDSEKHVREHEDWQEKRHVLALKADKIHSRTYRRVNSEKARQVVIDESKNNIRMISTESEKPEPNLEENEFSSMSNEELNRRVEEFIQRFYRQIRLQEIGSYSDEI